MLLIHTLIQVSFLSKSYPRSLCLLKNSCLEVRIVIYLLRRHSFSTSLVGAQWEEALSRACFPLCPPANRAEIPARLLKQILLKSIVDYLERDSARGAIQPGLKILARYIQTGLGFSARANGLKNLKKSHVIETEFQPGLESRKQDGCRYEVEAVSVE